MDIDGVDSILDGLRNQSIDDDIDIEDEIDNGMNI